jgi:hypothetical protein
MAGAPLSDRAGLAGLPQKPRTRIQLPVALRPGQTASAEISQAAAWLPTAFRWRSACKYEPARLD